MLAEVDHVDVNHHEVLDVDVDPNHNLDDDLDPHDNVDTIYNSDFRKGSGIGNAETYLIVARKSRQVWMCKLMTMSRQIFRIKITSWEKVDALTRG